MFMQPLLSVAPKVVEIAKGEHPFIGDSYEKSSR